MDIAEVARRAGVRASALRYYEELGLIRSNGRHGLRRLYDASVLPRLALITLGQQAGFTLDEISAMFAPDGRPQIDRQRLAQKADEIDVSIRRLQALRDSLRHAAACPAPDHLACPSFQRLLARASDSRRSRRRAAPINSRGGADSSADPSA